MICSTAEDEHEDGYYSIIYMGGDMLITGLLVTLTLESSNIPNCLASHQKH